MNIHHTHNIHYVCMLQNYNVIYVMQLQIMHFDYQKKLSLLCTNVSRYRSSNYFPNWKHLPTCIHLYIKWQMLLSYTLFVRFLPKFLLNINCHKDKNSTETNYSCIFWRKEWNEGNQQSFCLFKIILDSYWFITAIILLLFM